MAVRSCGNFTPTELVSFNNKLLPKSACRQRAGSGAHVCWQQKKKKNVKIYYNDVVWWYVCVRVRISVWQAALKVVSAQNWFIIDVRISSGIWGGKLYVAWMCWKKLELEKVFFSCAYLSMNLYYCRNVLSSWNIGRKLNNVWFEVILRLEFLPLQISHLILHNNYFLKIKNT